MTTTLTSLAKTSATRIRWSSNAAMFRSPLSGAVQTSQRLGGYWIAEVSWTALGQYESGQLYGDLFALDGSSSEVEIGPDRPYPLDHYNPNHASIRAHDAYTLRFKAFAGEYYVRYAAAPTILKNAAGSAGDTTLAVDGMDGVGFNKGDFISVNNGTYNELQLVTADAFPNASGEATLSIFPGLNRAVSDNVAITFESPTGGFIMAENDAASFNQRPGGVNIVDTITFEEFVR